MACTSELDSRVLIPVALRAAKKLCERHPHLDRDAAESVAMEAAMEVLRRWEAKRSSLLAFGRGVVAERLQRALSRGLLYADADARRLDAVPVDDLCGDGAEPSYCEPAIGETEDEVIAALKLDGGDERLLRERLGGGSGYEAAGSTAEANAVTTRLRRIKRRIDEYLQRNGGDEC